MKETIPVSITSGTIVKILAWIIIFAGLFYVRDFVVALFVAVVLASAAEMPVKAMMKSGLSRGISVTILFLALISIIVTTAFIFIPPLVDDVARFVQTLPQLLDSVRIFGRDMGFKDLSLYVQDLSKTIDKGQILTVLKTTFFGTSGIFATGAVVVGSIVNLVLTFVLAFYLALEERGVQKFLRLIVPKEHEGYIEDLWSRSQRKIGLWMQGQLLLSLLVSLLVYIPMLILGMPYAALLGVLAFLGELIPIVGLTFAAVPALFLAWSHGGATLLGIVALILFIIGQLENHVLYPRVMNKMVGVPSVLVIIALVMGAKFAGIWGVILSVPVAAIFMELATDHNKRKQGFIG
jgi:predicted PurR-regulated permease PerM